MHILTYTIEPIDKVLATTGYPYSSYDTAADIINALDRYANPIALVEVQIDNGGLELVRQLQGIPLLALAPTDLRVVALEAGATELLNIPLELTELQIRLKTLSAVQVRDDLSGSLDVLAHDLNNPLGITTSSLELAVEFAEEEGDHVLPELHQLIANVLLANHRLRFLIEDMLDYFRLEADGLPVMPQPVQVGPIIEAVTRGMRAIAEQNDISITVNLPDEFPQLIADAHLLQRVINAGVDTAIKFCQRGSDIEITVRADGTNAILTITDPGQTIHEDYHPQQLFGMADTSEMRDAGGRSAVGMSLPFIRVAMEKMNGTAQIATDYKTGLTALTLRLPLET